ncbi:ABC transporter permease [Xylanimonas protaetiae]|uniref:ABC transporter permease n=1 Tax=Xylanimonas protaetiae TaxID=2509457 RepID=UPI001F5C1D66|nr:ABC transporter permease [Xylanimonas protaetiae]
MTATIVSEAVAAPVVPPRARGLASAFAMFRNAKSITGLSILGVFVLMAVFAPLLTRFEPLEKDFQALRQPPSGTHWLGTTHMGEDVFAQIVYGTRGVLIVGFGAGVIATVIAIAIGVTAGYVSGWKSESLSALTNVFLVIPGLPLMIIITSQQENPSLWLVASVLAVTGWAWGGRVLRAQTMSLRNRDFVQAARANGEPLWRIITVEMLPNLMAIIASSFVGTVTAAILGLTTLAFVGVIPITNLNWGTILFWAQQNGAFPDFWWWYIPAGLAIALLGVALSLINFGIDEYVNPRLRSAGERARALRKRGMKASSSVTQVRAVAPAPPAVTSLDDVAAAGPATKKEA